MTFAENVKWIACNNKGNMGINTLLCDFNCSVESTVLTQTVLVVSETKKTTAINCLVLNKTVPVFMLWDWVSGAALL